MNVYLKQKILIELFLEITTKFLYSRGGGTSEFKIKVHLKLNPDLNFNPKNFIRFKKY